VGGVAGVGVATVIGLMVKGVIPGLGGVAAPSTPSLVDADAHDEGDRDAYAEVNPEMFM